MRLLFNLILPTLFSSTSIFSQAQSQNCTPPPTPFVAEGLFCGCSQATARASRNVAVTGKTFEWYADSMRQKLLPSRMSLENDVSLYDTKTNETVWVFEKENACYSEGKKVSLQVAPSPALPPSVPLASIFSCGSGTLSAVPNVSTNTIEWWGTANQTPGTRLGEGTSYTSMRTRSAFVHEVARQTCGSHTLGCYSIPKPVDFTISPPMTATISIESSRCNNQTTVLSAKVMGGTPPYVFNWGGIFFEQNYTVTKNGTYSVLVKDGAGCEGRDTVVVNNNCLVSSNDELTSEKTAQSIVIQSVTPNPAHDVLYLKLNSIQNFKAYTFQFYDALGRLVNSEKRQIQVGENLLTFDCSRLHSGLNIVVVEQQKVIRFIKLSR